MKHIFAQLLIAVSFIVNTASASESSLKILWDTYQRDVDGMRQRINTGNISDNELLQFRLTWKSRFSSAIQNEGENGGPYSVAVLSELEGLANVLGDFKTSERCIDVLLGYTNSPEWTFKWESELGEVQRKNFLLSGDTNIALKSIALLSKYSTNIINANWGLSVGKQLVVNWFYAGELNYQIGNYKSAILAYEMAQTVRNSLSERDKAGLVGFDNEQSASSILSCAARANDENAAGRALKELLQIKNPRIAPSYYAFDYADKNWTNNDAAVLTFKNNWIKSQPKDSWTPFMMLDVARDLIDAGKPGEALKYYQTLFANYTDAIKGADDKYKLTGTVRANYANLLLNASRAALLTGDKTQSDLWKDEYTKINPKETQVDRVNRVVGAGPNNSLIYPPPMRSNWKILVVIVCANLLIVAVFILLKFKKWRQSR